MPTVSLLWLSQLGYRGHYRTPGSSYPFGLQLLSYHNDLQAPHLSSYLQPRTPNGEAPLNLYRRCTWTAVSVPPLNPLKPVYYLPNNWIYLLFVRSYFFITITFENTHFNPNYSICG